MESTFTTMFGYFLSLAVCSPWQSVQSACNVSAEDLVKCDAASLHTVPWNFTEFRVFSEVYRIHAKCNQSLLFIIGENFVGFLEDSSRRKTAVSKSDLSYSLGGFTFRLNMLVKEHNLLANIAALNVIIQQQQWSSVHIIYEDKYFHLLNGEIDTNGCVIDWIPIQNAPHRIRAVIIQTVAMEKIQDQRNALNFIVVAHSEDITHILNRAGDLDKQFGVNFLLRHLSKWLLLPPNGQLCLNTNFDNVATIDVYQDNPVSKSSVLKSRILNSCVMQAVPWILQRYEACIQLNLSDCYEEMIQITEKILTSTSGHVRTLMWHSPYRKLQEVATVSISGELAWSLDLFPNLHFGLNERELVFTINEWKPYAIKNESSSIPSYYGICPFILRNLAQKYNFRYVTPHDEQWGTLIGNSWTGIIGDLQRQVADMSGLWMAEDFDRTRDVDFSYPMEITSYTIMYFNPPKENPYRFLTRQFRAEVYLCGLVALVVVAILFFIMETQARGEVQADKATHLAKAGTIAYNLVAASLHQGIGRFPSTTSGRTLMASWWLYTLVITTIYCGNLIAFQAVSKGSKPFKTIPELLERREFSVGVEGSTVVVSKIKSSSDPVLRSLWKRLQHSVAEDPSVMSVNLSLHYERLSDGNYAFIGETMTLPFLKSRSCQVDTLDRGFFYAPYSFVFPKNSPLQKLLRHELMKTSESGIISWLLDRRYPRRWCSQRRDSAKRIHFLDYIGALIACGVGVAAALFILTIELLMCKRTKTVKS